MEILKNAYKILDLFVEIESDSKDFLKMIERDYSWFSDNRKKDINIDFYARLINKNLIIQNEFLDLSQYPEPEYLAYQIILKRIFDLLNNFFIIHAGVIIFGENALVLAGPPGIGKSTLVMELIKKGNTFFSDDFCPINRKDNMVYPFPRSIWLKPKEEIKQNNREYIRDKIPLDILNYKKCIPEKRPKKIKWIIYLDHGKKINNNCELIIYTRDANCQVINDLKKIDHISIKGINNNLCMHKIKYPTGKGLTSCIKQTIENNKDDVWNFFRIDKTNPDFSKKSEYSKIKSSEAAFLLMRDLKNDFSKRELKIPPAQLLMELSVLLKCSLCYRVTTGNLQSILNNIYDIIEI